ENLRFFGMHLSVRHPSVIAGVCPTHDFYPHSARSLQNVHKAFHIALHPVNANLNLVLANFTTEVQNPLDKGRGWHDADAVLCDGLELGFGCQVGMHDPVDSRFCSRPGRSRSSRVNRNPDVVTVGFVNYRRDLLLGNGLGLAGAAIGHLDKVDAVLALSSHFTDHLPRTLAERADAVLRGAHPRWFFVLYRTVGYDHPTGTVHARALDQPKLDGVSHRQIGKPSATRHGDAGYSGSQYLLGILCRPEGIEFRSRRTLASGFAGQFRIAVGKVRMGID